MLIVVTQRKKKKKKTTASRSLEQGTGPTRPTSTTHHTLPHTPGMGTPAALPPQPTIANPPPLFAKQTTEAQQQPRPHMERTPEYINTETTLSVLFDNTSVAISRGVAMFTLYALKRRDELLA